MKEAFIVRSEWMEAVMDLELTDQAIIFRNIYFYNKGELERIDLSSPVLKLAWRFIEPNLGRINESYEKRSAANRLKGQLSGIARTKSNQIEPTSTNANQLQPIDIDIDKDKDIDKAVDESTAREVPPSSSPPFGKVVMTSDLNFVEKICDESESEFQNMCKKNGLLGDFNSAAAKFYKTQKAFSKNWRDFTDFKQHFFYSIGKDFGKGPPAQETPDERMKRERGDTTKRWNMHSSSDIPAMRAARIAELEAKNKQT